jgi:type II secretory pathway predicted ATPase ExeA
MITQSPKRFNITGPCVPEDHYMLPVLPRLPLVDDMIASKSYFILHAPRQSGKTTFIKAFAEKINRDGQRYALNCSLSSLRSITDKNEALTTIFSQLNESLLTSNVNILIQKADTYDSLPGMTAPDRKVKRFLNQLCQDLVKPLVVFFDEADLLTGLGLLTFLAQIRDGFNDRDNYSNKFPSSLALVGMRNIRDYLASNHPESTGEHLASPFNIVAERMTLANFTQDQIGQLYSQHTEATGQVFHDEAIERAWYWTEGQPWLVNALARQTVEVILKKDYSVNITAKIIDDVAQSLILRNDTHFDSLKERLKESRVRRVIEAIMIGSDEFPNGIADDDVQYVLDLGLLKKNSKDDTVIQPSNPIYQEVIVRTLTSKIQSKIKKAIPITFGNKWMDGTYLDMTGLLKGFQIYWSENSEMYIQDNLIDSQISTSIYSALKKNDLLNEEKMFEDIIRVIKDNLIGLANEALTHLVLFAYLQRVLNGGADFIQREYALGTLRADICVSYKGIRYPLELKIKGHKSQKESIEQLKSYMNKCLASEGWLVVFDKNFNKPWKEKISWNTIKDRVKSIHIVSC